MSDTTWLKQSKDQPLFKDLLWSRPETKARAGKLLIVGGSAHGFKAPATAYNLAMKAGAGSLKVLLPASLRSTVGKYIEDAIYCPSNKSGGFARESLAEFIDYAAWADLTLLCGDFGHNSETAILLESLSQDHKGPICLSGDSLDSFLANPLTILDRPNTLIVSNLGTLQKLVLKSNSPKAITSSLSLIQLVEVLGELTKNHAAAIITDHLEHLIVALSGKVSTTSYDRQIKDWTLNTATYTSVWWLQNESRPFEALTTAIYCSINPDS
jgi:ADP-dependent NAD(P)H-hydrate dehydratase / NAD(P)H-hydrate epimerase